MNFPPVGIAHLTTHPLDLIRRRVDGNVNVIEFACVTQPKTEPHFGTAILLYVAFALASESRKLFNLPSRVLLDTLENSPAREWQMDGSRYFTPLDREYVDGVSVAASATAPLVQICEFLSRLSGVHYATRSYQEIQRQPAFRGGLRRLLEGEEVFARLVSPNGDRMRVRPLCPLCGTGNKDASQVRWKNLSIDSLIWSRCPAHGEFSVDIRDRTAVLDCNTPVRSVLRSLAFVESNTSDGTLSVLVNGADWAGEWMQHIYLLTLERLGVRVSETPPTLFSPLVLDEFGGKLSKTIYLQPGAYDHLSPAWRSYTGFIDTYGRGAPYKLWREISGWGSDPGRFFRNYSLKYFEEVFAEFQTFPEHNQ